MAKGVATDRGTRLRRTSAGSSSQLASSQALTPAMRLPTDTPTSRMGQ